MANLTGFDHFHALLQQLQALLVDQQTAFLIAAQLRTPHNPAMPMTPKTVAAVGGREQHRVWKASLQLLSQRQRRKKLSVHLQPYSR